MALVQKISVSLAAEDLAWARARAKRQGRSLSSLLTDALHQQRQAEARWKLLQQLGHTDISEQEVDALRREMVAPQVTRKTKAVRAARR